MFNFDTTAFEAMISNAIRTELTAFQTNSQHGSPNDGQLAYTLEQAGERLGVKSHVIRDAADRGEISTIKIGRRRCVRHAELIAYLDRQQAH